MASNIKVKIWMWYERMKLMESVTDAAVNNVCVCVCVLYVSLCVQYLKYENHLLYKGLLIVRYLECQKQCGVTDSTFATLRFSARLVYHNSTFSVSGRHSA